MKESGVAEDLNSGAIFPTPSHRPYHVIFISQSEFERLQSHRAENRGYPLFQAAQRYFGEIPGFSFRSNWLSSPEDYATAREIIPASRLVTTKLVQRRARALLEASKVIEKYFQK